MLSCKSKFVHVVLSACFFALSTLPSFAASPAGSKPNVIFILCDDLGYGDLGCFGQKKNKTPNIDSLAKEGILFTDHYSGSTVCAPSRSVLMTGQHTGHTPVRGNGAIGRRPDGSDPRALPADSYTIPKMFKKAGYQTGMFGKWGLGTHEDTGNIRTQGFDAFYGYYSQSHAHTFYPLFLWDDQEKIEMDGNTYSHDLIWNKGLDFIRKNARSKTPFFVYYSITVPHAAMSAPPDLHEKWRKVYPEFDSTIGKYGGMGMGKDREVINPIAGFAAMIENLDNQVGALLKELKTLGVDNNTMVVFTSDNGAHHEGGHDPEFWDSNGPLRGLKRNLTEGGIRTPMLIRWPDVIKAGSRTDHISAFWDFLPTFAEMAGQSVPENARIDGISMLPVLTGHENSQPKHKALYWAFNEKGPKQALRAGKWKLIRYRDNESGKHDVHLYDLQKDIGEENNLAASNPEVVASLLKLMDAEHEESPFYPVEKAVKKRKEIKTSSVANQPLIFTCRVVPQAGEPDGVLVVRGGRAEGASVYVKNGSLHFTVCRSGKKTTIKSSVQVPVNEYAVEATLMKGGEMKLKLNGESVATGNAGGLLTRDPGEPFSAGKDEITSAGEYEIPFAYKGKVFSAQLNGMNF